MTDYTPGNRVLFTSGLNTRIGAQRAGNAYEQKVLKADAGDLMDLSDLVNIPSLSAFAKEQQS